MRIGGTEQVIRNLIEGGDPARLTQAIFCIEEPLGPWGRDLRDKGLRIDSCNRRPGFDRHVVGRLRRFLRETAADVVHCHQYTPWVYGTLAALGLRTRVVFTEHGRFYPDRASAKRRYINPVLARMTARITAISEATKQALVRYEYLREDRIDVIYNGIQGLAANPDAAARLRSELQIPTGAPVLGTIARFDPIKNHPMMLRAFRRVLDAHPECRLLLVGDGEERATIEALIAELDLGGRVILPGYIPEPAAWLEAMDIFLLSSFSEGTSMTLLEAMSLGKPCVVTEVGGNPEIVQAGVTGAVAASDDADAFAGDVLAILADHALLAQLSAAARTRFREHFSSATMARRFAAVYASAMGARLPRDSTPSTGRPG
jgi:glycosyltransferase involved in cell wall biosynthesis